MTFCAKLLNFTEWQFESKQLKSFTVIAGDPLLGSHHPSLLIKPSSCMI